MLTIIFWLIFILGIYAAYHVGSKNNNWFWLSGLFMYILSFLGSFSIGGYILSITFILWALAIGYSLQLIKKPYQIVLTIIIGLASWIIVVTTLDDVWWYLLFRLIM